MPKYQPGDYSKVEIDGEIVWVRIVRVDGRARAIVGIVDNVPTTDYGGKLQVGSRLFVSYDKVRDHKKSTDF